MGGRLWIGLGIATLIVTLWTLYGNASSKGSAGSAEIAQRRINYDPSRGGIGRLPKTE